MRHFACPCSLLGLDRRTSVNRPIRLIGKGHRRFAPLVGTTNSHAAVSPFPFTRRTIRLRHNSAPLVACLHRLRFARALSSPVHADSVGAFPNSNEPPITNQGLSVQAYRAQHKSPWEFQPQALSLGSARWHELSSSRSPALARFDPLSSATPRCGVAAARIRLWHHPLCQTIQLCARVGVLKGANAPALGSGHTLGCFGSVTHLARL